MGLGSIPLSPQWARGYLQFRSKPASSTRMSFLVKKQNKTKKPKKIKKQTNKQQQQQPDRSLPPPKKTK